MPRPPERITFTWRDITCRVEHIRDFKIDGWSKLIVRVVSPRGAPLPVTESGYLEHQLDEDVVIAAGGLVPYLTTWMDRTAIYPRYAQALAKWKQADLFR